MAAFSEAPRPPVLEILKFHDKSHTFSQPIKRIHEGEDVSKFLVSRAHTDLMIFILQLNKAMFPCYDAEGKIKSWELNSPHVRLSECVQQLQILLSKLEGYIEEALPDPGPRRFGNISFRKWHNLLETRVSSLLDECLPQKISNIGQHSNLGPKIELGSYLLGSFGSPQRLDFGTGHELSFLAFLGCIWKLGGFADSKNGEEERGILLGVLETYLQLCRHLIKIYTLEPAGSHGVWGLDDHFFLPYIFGSAQLSAPISEQGQIPTEGSLPDAPDPPSVVKPVVVEREREKSMYFSAIGFIHDVKKGPFWEHSPILYDISGVRAGWAKINKHFPFGSLFSFSRDPAAGPSPTSVHMLSQPSRSLIDPMQAGVPTSRVPTEIGTKAPWASTTRPPPGAAQSGSGTMAPWATQTQTNRPSAQDNIPSRRP
ncbi:MAG: Serine/threonine-protein phosphatase 2A activator 1 [Cirrosporium novae-zelandiae]|nr:MAG: Serine/threonine-protein phosphatase 2A activator 1 [Cirrosporium novae-zelandiae]